MIALRLISDVCFDEILLKANYFVYKCRMNKIRPNIRYFIDNDLKQIKKIDKHVHYLEMNTDIFFNKKSYCALLL